MRVFCCLAILAAIIATRVAAFGEDTELRDLDVTSWDCLNQVSGTAKTQDGIERNRMKNRSLIDLSGITIESLDTTAFLKKVGEYDAKIEGKRRGQLSADQKAQLDGFEKQIISLIGWVVLSYAGPPETTNCGDATFHDWHLEIFENLADHAPHIGDPTPIICEITPRTEQKLYRDGVRIQALTGFFRLQTKKNQSTGHSAQKVRVTGYLTWDDDHNGTADVGVKIENVSANKFHHPWRSTAWEVHPVIKVETLGQDAEAVSANPQPTPTASATPVIETAQPATPSPSVQPQFVTITRPVRITIPYGEVLLSPGMKLPLVSREGTAARVRYMNDVHTIPISSTDLH